MADKKQIFATFLFTRNDVINQIIFTIPEKYCLKKSTPKNFTKRIFGENLRVSKKELTGLANLETSRGLQKFLVLAALERRIRLHTRRQSFWNTAAILINL